jgi:hypothetical protein
MCRPDCPPQVGRFWLDWAAWVPCTSSACPACPSRYGSGQHLRYVGSGGGSIPHFRRCSIHTYMPWGRRRHGSSRCARRIDSMRRSSRRRSADGRRVLAARQGARRDRPPALRQQAADRLALRTPGNRNQSCARPRVPFSRSRGEAPGSRRTPRGTSGRLRCRLAVPVGVRAGRATGLAR